MNTKAKAAPKPAFTMKPVKSSIIASHGFDAASNTLAVTFKSGLTYHYPGVSQELADKLDKAESVGSFFGSHIRKAFKGIAQPK